MEKIDLKNLEGKNLKEIIEFAENLSSKNLEDKINAYKIFLLLIDQTPNIYNHPYPNIRGFLRGKIWNLEKFFNWNEKYYSQFGQDKFIKETFFRNKKKGFFLEIGAYDGIAGSNCFYFEKFLHWEGIAIEPSLTQFKKLKKNRKCNCLNNAISTNNQKIDFNDVIEGLTMMSGPDNASYKKTLDVINSDARSKIQKYKVEAVTFDKIVPKKKLIDYLSIDIEGGELDVLKTIDFNSYDIKVISVENNDPKNINLNAIMKEKNFKYFDNFGVDEIYYNYKYFKF